MLDIGTDVGALVVYSSELLAGQEIEIRPHGGSWAGLHTAVRPRHLGTAVLYAGVFGSLAAGSYDLRVRSVAPGAHHHHSHDPDSAPHTHTHTLDHGPTAQTVDVVAGAVTETTLDDAVDCL
jgi:hypothetical protein